MMVRVLFIIELVAACVALFILFGDTLHLLIPDVGTTEWKILCGLILVPLMFAPLRHLSFTSVLGIISCFSSTYFPTHPASQCVSEFGNHQYLPTTTFSSSSPRKLKVNDPTSAFYPKSCLGSSDYSYESFPWKLTLIGKDPKFWHSLVISSL